MNEKYIWPLAGVILGWLLTSISAGLKESNNKKRLIGNLITKLIRVEYEARLIINASEAMKDFADSWEEYEPIRQYLLNQHFLSSESFRNNLESAISDIDPLYPVMGIDLDNLYQMLLKNKYGALSASSKNQEAYIRMLSIYEAGLEICNALLKKRILHLAFRHGVFTYIQIRYMYLKQNKNRERTSNSVNTLINDIRNKLKNTDNKE